MVVGAPAIAPRRIVVKLRPLPARLHIIGAPAGGLIRVADRRVPVGDAPVVIELDLAAASRELVEILGPTGATVERRVVDLSPTEETTLALEPEP